MNQQAPLAVEAAAASLWRSTTHGVGLVARRRVHQPPDLVGRRLHFADGTSAVVYRETRLERRAPAQPAVLVVGFRLRLVRGRGHAVVGPASELTTPLFIGFPGFASKLWLGHDGHGRYRGVYEWDGAAPAEAYARALWRLLALVSVPGSVGYHVLPDVARDVALDFPAAGPPEWWRPVVAPAL
ncbi:hypothetical protein [Oryzihumus sp.]|jgi:hypothetical protein|uniref:hypothetical protein n=1 Tax=Oryzihumus sp. TaxID=1968903 RepID=UPI002ED96594